MQSGRPVSAGIVATGIYLPEKILTNADLEKMVETEDKWITSRTGIRERRIIAEGEGTSDLAARAAQAALEKAEMTPEEIDLIIVATITPDMFFPATSCLVQHKIGARRAAAFDLSAGCTGFVYALSTASQFIANRVYQNVLVIGAESMSRVINWQDRNTCVLFGDAAGAAILKPVEDDLGLKSVVLGADGSGGDLLKVEAGGTWKPITEAGLNSPDRYLYMAGREVFKFAVKTMGESALAALKEAGLDKQDIDLFIPHQANIRIIEAAAKRLDLPMHKVFVNVQKYGNTSAASIPIALEEALTEGRIKKGDNLVLVGFGTGLTWGACVIRWAV